MRHPDIIARQKAIAAEIDALANLPDLDAEQESRWHSITDEFERLDAQRQTIERQHDLTVIRSAMDAGMVEIGTPVNTVDGYGSKDKEHPMSASPARVRSVELLRRIGDPWSPDTVKAHPVRDVARAAVERAPDIAPAGRERVIRAVEESDRPAESVTKLSRWAACTSDPAYRSAWVKLAADPVGGHREWTADELRAFQRVQSESRAMSLTDSAGGYLVPFQMDPAVILANDGTTGVLRQLARTVIATGDVWNGVSSAGITAGWYSEATEVDDDAPTLAQPAISVHRSSAFVPVSFEAFDDAANVAGEVAKMLTDALFRLDEEAFTTGSGTGQPFGIITALTGGSSEVNQTGSSLDAADWFAVQNALGPRYQQNASWIAHLVSLNTARATAIGSGLDSPMLVEGNPPTILGKPAYEANFMDSSVTGSASDYLAVYGDFSNYVIADRIGMTIELVPHLVGSNRRPTGQRGWFAWRRVGADSVNDAAFRMLDKSA